MSGAYAMILLLSPRPQRVRSTIASRQLAASYECRQKHREFYYEYLHKREARFEAAKKNLRSRSPKKMGLAWQEIALMRRRFDDFERLSAVRFQKLMGQA